MMTSRALRDSAKSNHLNGIHGHDASYARLLLQRSLVAWLSACSSDVWGGQGIIQLIAGYETRESVDLGKPRTQTSDHDKWKTDNLTQPEIGRGSCYATRRVPDRTIRYDYGKECPSRPQLLIVFAF